MLKRCVLDELKLCDNCGECNRCDLDPNKICDNCCKCLSKEGTDTEYRSVPVTFLNALEQEQDGDMCCLTDDEYAPDFEEAIEVPQIDKELLEKWEDILSKDAENLKKHNTNENMPMLHAVRRRRGR